MHGAMMPVLPLNRPSQLVSPSNSSTVSSPSQASPHAYPDTLSSANPESSEDDKKLVGNPLMSGPPHYQHIIEGRNFLELCSAHGHTSSESVQDRLEQEEEEHEVHMCHWEECGQQFALLNQLVSHLEHQHTLSLQHYICHWTGCSRDKKPFDARYKLVTHLRCHTGERPYHCTYPNCNRKFSRLENLKLHTRTHTGEKPYTCHHDGCGKRFNNTSDRAKHMKTHITRKPYMCKHPGCGKAYTDPSSMRKHNKFAHLQNKPLRSRSTGSISDTIHSPPVIHSNQLALPMPPTSSTVTVATVSSAESCMETSVQATTSTSTHSVSRMVLQTPPPRTSLISTGAALAPLQPQMLLYTPHIQQQQPTVIQQPTILAPQLQQPTMIAPTMAPSQTHLVSLLPRQLTHQVCPMIVSALPGAQPSSQTVIPGISPSSSGAVMYQSLMPVMLPLMSTTSPITSTT